jgi:GNAT superfamily N-acetyltransferase
MNTAFPVFSKNKHVLVDLLITVVGISGFVFFYLFANRALPDASLDMKYSRDVIIQKAADYLGEFGFTIDGYKQAVYFGSDNNASFYLQRKLGLEQTNTRKANEKWPLYYWQMRWFKVQQKEEFYISLTPSGDLLSFNHIIKEDTPGESLSQDQAQQLAERFLTHYAGWNVSEWERIEASSEAKPGGRIDHSFAWKSRSFSAAEAELRSTVTVQGDQVGNMDQFIKLPESYGRDLAAERDQAGFINTLAYLGAMIGFLFIAGLAMVMIPGKVSMRHAAFPALLVGAVTLANQLNYLGFANNSYATTQDYTLFWFQRIFGMFLSTVFTALLVLVAWAGAQSLSKLVWPHQDRILARGPQRWVTLSRSSWRGLMLSGFHLGYLVLFYLLTSRYLGWWSPMTPAFGNFFATPFPFLDAFETGLSAALTEELLVRFVGAAFFFWLFRKRLAWLAVLIPGVFWAFAHTGYMTFPIYVRGVELTVVALVYGYMFFKFDLFTTLMAHFSYNMLITAMPLLLSDVPSYRYSGLIVLLVLLLPLLPGPLWSLAKRLGKLPHLPENIYLNPASAEDQTVLSALPIKADWETLLMDPKRVTLCLRADAEIIGVASGQIDAQNVGQIDAVYVSPRWRRQSWGSTLLEALQKQLDDLGAVNVHAVLLSNEKQSVNFLNNAFWRSSARVLSPGVTPTPSGLLANLKEEGTRLRRTSAQEIDLQIPRKIL